MVHLIVILENSDSGYLAGQTFKGTVELYLDQPKKVHGLYFIIYGDAHCMWEKEIEEEVGQGDQRRKAKRKIHYIGTEIFLNSKTYLFGAKGERSTEMASGTYRYKFECLLPPTIPASFKGSFGSIRYNIEACLDIPWRFDKETRVFFNVIRHDDLNQQLELKMPCLQEEIKTFFCLFCKSAPMIVTVSIPFSGFVPGQTIPVTIKYDNKSHQNALQTKIEFYSINRFTCDQPNLDTKTVRTNLFSINKLGVRGREAKSFIVELEVSPHIKSSNTQFCKLIQVSYEISVEAEFSYCHRNVKMVFPITIGAVPIEAADQPSNIRLALLPSVH